MVNAPLVRKSWIRNFMGDGDRGDREISSIVPLKQRDIDSGNWQGQSENESGREKGKAKSDFG